MHDYWQIFINGYKGYANYFWHEITHPSWHNYFYWLILVSAFFFFLEIIAPWRKDQPKFRKDFWLDFFYMFFNFFLFSLIVYNAASDVVVNFINNLIKSGLSFDLQAANPLRNFPTWAILIIGFLVRDFVQWWVHRLLHWSDWLWEFHKVHHSVEQMGFAAHLRYHWMENVVYRSIEYLPLALLGIGLYDFFVIHIFTLAIGHFNHSNITVSGYISAAIVGALVGIAIVTQSFDIALVSITPIIAKIGVVLLTTVVFAMVLGPVMKKVFNNPEMHIWHHAYNLPSNKKFGINFGISLAIWDYIFGTAHVPGSGRDIALGFPGMEKFPENFLGQNIHGYIKDGAEGSVRVE